MSLRDHRAAAAAATWRRAQLQATVEPSDERRRSWLKKHARREHERASREQARPKAGKPKP